MKSIKEMFIDTQNGRGKVNNINEFAIAGTIIASLALGSILGAGNLAKNVGSFFTNLFGGGKTPEERRQEEQARLKHQVEMTEIQTELLKAEQELQKQADTEKGDDYGKSNVSGSDAQKKVDELQKKKDDMAAAQAAKDKESGIIPKDRILALADKSLNDISDPIEKGKMQSQLDLARCTAMNPDGTPRTDEDMQNWLNTNIDPEDLKTFKEMTEKSFKDIPLNDTDKVSQEIKDKASGLSDEDVDSARETAKKTSADLGKKIEADTAKRKEYQETIEKKQKERDAQVAELDKAIADAGTDEQKVKEAKRAKLEYLKKADNEILDQKEQLAKFNAECESGKMLNAMIPDRKERCEKTIQAVADERKTTNEKYEKESQEIEGTKPAGGQEPPAATNDDVKKAQNNQQNGDKEEIIKGIDNDGDHNGETYKKITDKDGNVKYTMTDKDGETIDIDAKDFEDMKKKHDDYEDKSNGDDEKTGDVDTDDDDVNGEGEAGKKKIKNPAKIWKRKKNKNTSKLTKSYYNKNGDSMSADEFRKKMEHYKEKLQKKNESFNSYLKWHNPDNNKYNSISNMIRENMNE